MDTEYTLLNFEYIDVLNKYTYIEINDVKNGNETRIYIDNVLHLRLIAQQLNDLADEIENNE